MIESWCLGVVTEKKEWLNACISPQYRVNFQCLKHYEIQPKQYPPFRCGQQ